MYDNIYLNAVLSLETRPISISFGFKSAVKTEDKQEIANLN